MGSCLCGPYSSCLTYPAPCLNTTCSRPLRSRSSHAGGLGDRSRMRGQSSFQIIPLIHRDNIPTSTIIFSTSQKQNSNRYSSTPPPRGEDQTPWHLIRIFFVNETRVLRDKSVRMLKTKKIQQKFGGLYACLSPGLSSSRYYAVLIVLQTFEQPLVRTKTFFCNFRGIIHNWKTRGRRVAWAWSSTRACVSKTYTKKRFSVHNPIVVKNASHHLNISCSGKM